jgi:hypothetical protein
MVLGGYFSANVLNVSYFFGSLIDVLMLIDRIGIFNKEFKKLVKMSPYKMCTVVFVTVIVIDSPNYFIEMLESESFKLNATSSYKVWYYKISDFANSELGTVLNYLLIAVREVLITVAQIGLNLTSIYLFRKYLEKRRQLLHVEGTSMTRLNTMNASANQHVEQASDMSSRVSSAEQRATVMCILMCLLSVVEHFLVIVCIVCVYLNLSYFNLILVYNCSFLWQLVKRIADFMILFYVNKMFQKACLKLLRMN